MRFIKNRLNNLPLRWKIFSILLLTLAPMIVISIFGISFISNSYEEVLYKSIAGQLSYSEQVITYELDGIESLSYLILSNDHVQENLEILKYSDDPVARSNANKELRALLWDFNENFRTRHLSYIELICDEFNVSSNSYYSDKTPAFVHDTVKEKALEANGAPVWMSSYDKVYGLFLGREIRKIKDFSHDELGEQILRVDISELISDATQFGNQYETADYLLMNQDEIMYYPDTMTQETAEWIREQLSKPYQILNYGDHHYFAVQGKIHSRGWDYICLVSYDQIATVIRKSQLLFITLFLLFAAIASMLTLTMISSLTGHFDFLIKKMDAVSSNEPQLPSNGYDYNSRFDEIGTIHQQFDQTYYKLQELIKTNYVSEILRQEAQLKALENQINPHFLYNTLESINWRAQALGANDISSMIQSLGILLRSTLSSDDKSYTLRDELNLINNYMTIQKYRFEERLVYEVSVPDELMDTTIPKLLLQPLAENAIYYGLEENIDGCEIIINAESNQNTLYIYVKNSGSLFEDNLMDKLRNNVITPHGHGIGLLNSQKRISLSYGEKFGLKLYNEDEMAVALITIPIKKEDHHDENIDRR